MTTMQTNVPLAPYTSFKCGGTAEYFALCKSRDEVSALLDTNGTEMVRLLGYGTNVLISDHGLPGLTIVWHGGEISHEGATIAAEGGVWWDDVVQYAYARNLFGVELMSGIPGSVGAAVAGNVAAYGQAVRDTFADAEVYDLSTRTIQTLSPGDLQFGYRSSVLPQMPHILLRARFTLSKTATTPLRYASALAIAKERGDNLDSFEGRRATILETRRRAGSLYDCRKPDEARTAGSFFKNPIVTKEQAGDIASFDETGKSLERLAEQNAIHGGSPMRVSAAHVLLAAGFKRGQSWGPVRLHPHHVLKIENTGEATAQDIYNVSQIIMLTVREKLGITLEPEVRMMGDFS